MNLILKVIIGKVFSKIRFAKISFSQEGEDAIADRFLKPKLNGFFIDVGAHHPIHLSNTYLFYLRGWRGVNIDAMPGSMNVFKKVRPEDINIECPVSDREEILTYYIFDDPALNTFSKEEAARKNKLANYKIVRTIELKTQTLANILDKNLKEGQEIDLMSIDVEGFDLKILHSNNWNRYRPRLIMVESLNGAHTLDSIMSDPVYKYMCDTNYEFCAKTLNTLFFRDGTVNDL